MWLLFQCCIGNTLHYDCMTVVSSVLSQDYHSYLLTCSLSVSTVVAIIVSKSTYKLTVVSANMTTITLVLLSS